MTLRKKKISRKRASSNRAKKTKKQVGGWSLVRDPYAGAEQFAAMRARVQAGQRAAYKAGDRGAYGRPRISQAEAARQARNPSVHLSGKTRRLRGY